MGGSRGAQTLAAARQEGACAPRSGMGAATLRRPASMLPCSQCLDASVPVSPCAQALRSAPFLVRACASTCAGMHLCRLCSHNVCGLQCAGLRAACKCMEPGCVCASQQPHTPVALAGMSAPSALAWVAREPAARVETAHQVQRLPQLLPAATRRPGKARVVAARASLACPWPASLPRVSLARKPGPYQPSTFEGWEVKTAVYPASGRRAGSGCRGEVVSGACRQVGCMCRPARAGGD